MRRKNNYAMVKLAVPKRVTLPNGRTFVARYKRIKRSELPPNIVMRKTLGKELLLKVDVEEEDISKVKQFLVL